ncbi:MAG: hypothetical protein RMJ89_02960 [Flammeovirgaceae bacterium]|nr:hypothetical protein [Flammeovirgaceae bacterium]
MDKVRTLFIITLTSFHISMVNAFDVEKIASDSTYQYTIQDLLVVLGAATVYAKDTVFERQVMADRLFTIVASQLEKKLSNKEIKKNDDTFLYMQHILNAYHYHLAVPFSDTEKLVHYLKEGRIDYILHRVVSRGYLQYILAIILIFSLLTIIWRRWIRITSKTSS